MNLAVIQLDITPREPETNLSRAEKAVEQAADSGADLVVLPEQFVVGFFAFDAYSSYATGLDGAIFERLAAVAADNNVGLVAGSTVEDLEASAAAGYAVPDDDGYANTTVFFDRDGTQRGVYRKHHLFGYDSTEAELLVAGQSLAVVDFEGLSVGMTTCYDLRFPELYRTLVDRGAELVVVPSAWPYPRTEHWKTLSRARAIENLCYVATANGSGRFSEAEAQLCGRSTVYDPWGTTLASSGEEPTQLIVEIDTHRIETIRSTFPALDDRRH